MVKDIEELRAELQIQSVEDLGALGKRKIDVPELRPEVGVSSEVTKRAICRLLECRPVQIADKIRGRLPVRFDRLLKLSLKNALVSFALTIGTGRPLCAVTIVFTAHPSARRFGPNSFGT